MSRPPARPAPPRGIPFGPHRPRIHPSAFVTEGTYIVGRVSVARRASVWFGAVLRGDFEPIRVGEESLIEDNVVVHGRTVVGRRCVIGHGAILHGCSIGDGAVVGSNAVVFDGARIGRDSLVVAGSVVYPGTRVPARSVYRNAAAAGPPSVGPVGNRLRRWQARAYQRVIRIYERGPSGTPAPRRRARRQPPGARRPPG